MLSSNSSDLLILLYAIIPVVKIATLNFYSMKIEIWMTENYRHCYNAWKITNNLGSWWCYYWILWSFKWKSGRFTWGKAGNSVASILCCIAEVVFLFRILARDLNGLLSPSLSFKIKDTSETCQATVRTTMAETRQWVMKFCLFTSFISFTISFSVKFFWIILSSCWECLRRPCSLVDSTCSW